MTKGVGNGASAWFGQVTLRKGCLELQVHRKRPLSSSILLLSLLPPLLLYEFGEQANYFKVCLVYKFPVCAVSKVSDL